MRDSPKKVQKMIETLQGPWKDPVFRATTDVIPQNVRGDVKGW